MWRLRSTRASWTRSSSSNTSRRRASSSCAIDSGAWMPANAAVPVDEVVAVEHPVGHRVGEAPRLRAAQRLVHPVADLPGGQAGLLGLRVDRHDAAGPVADEVDDRVGHLLRPRYISTLPNSATVMPGRSCRSRHGWLKNVTRRCPLPSVTSTVDQRLGRPAPGPPRRCPLDRDQDQRLLAHPQVADRGLVGAVEVAPRVVGEQVEHVSTPSVRQRLGLRSPTPLSRVTGSAASSPSVIGAASVAVGRLLDAEEVRVERLAAVVDLGATLGAVLGQPLGDVAGVGRRSAPSPSMTVTISWLVGRPARRAARWRPSASVGSTARMPSRAMPSQSPSAIGPDVAGRVAHRLGDLAGHHVGRQRRPSPWRCRRPGASGS